MNTWLDFLPQTAPFWIKGNKAPAGTLQGGVISPVLANLFMHYAFDSWMTEKYSKCPRERYADDGIIHCVSRKQAEFVLDMLKEQMKRYGLIIHPEERVFCRKNTIPKGVKTSFVFWGYCFRPRLVKSTQGIYFMGFTPAVSVEAARSFRKKIRVTIKEAGTTDIIILSQMLNSRKYSEYALQKNEGIEVSLAPGREQRLIAGDLFCLIVRSGVLTHLYLV